MIQAHAQAIIDALEAAGLAVGDGTVQGLPRPCCAVHVIPGRPFRVDLDGAQHGRHVDFPIVLVADEARGVRWLADRIEAALLDLRLTVDGRVSAPMTRIASSPPSPDNDLVPAAWSATDTYRATSVRAQEPA